jgi:hypothetical protein
MDAQKTIILKRFLIAASILGAYYLGALAYVPSAKQTAEAQGQLQDEYAQDNTRYFSGQLPPAVIQMAEIPPDDKGNYFLGDSGRGLFGAFVIRIDPRMNPAGQTAHATLLHEMCHFDAWEKTGDFDSGHGAAFQACEQRLLDAGATRELF